MSKTLITLVVALSTIGLSGCSSAGPFVTNISADGRGGLTYEKCLVQYNSFTNNLSIKECSQFDIQIISQKKFEEME